MRVWLMIEGQEGVTWDDWVALARACEDARLDSLFRSDHYLAIITAGRRRPRCVGDPRRAGRGHERVRLGTLVSPVTFRHPSVLARMATTADHVSGGT